MSDLSFCHVSPLILSDLSSSYVSPLILSDLPSCYVSPLILSDVSSCYVSPLILSCLTSHPVMSHHVMSVRSLYTILPSCPVCPQSLQFSPQRELLSWIRTVGLRGGNLPPNHSFFLLPPLLAELVYYVQHKQYTLENTLRNIKSARNLRQDVMMLLFLFCCPRQR